MCLKPRLAPPQPESDEAPRAKPVNLPDADRQSHRDQRADEDGGLPTWPGSLVQSSTSNFHKIAGATINLIETRDFSAGRRVCRSSISVLTSRLGRTHARPVQS